MADTVFKITRRGATRSKFGVYKKFSHLFLGEFTGEYTWELIGTAITYDEAMAIIQDEIEFPYGTSIYFDEDGNRIDG